MGYMNSFWNEFDVVIHKKYQKVILVNEEIRGVKIPIITLKKYVRP